MPPPLVGESKVVSEIEQLSLVSHYMFQGMLHEEFIGVRPAQGLDADQLAPTKLELTQRCASTQVEHL